jgi:ABC-type molybdate transport system substrate-binding protein
MNIRRIGCIGLFALITAFQFCAAQEITVAAAADLQFAMQDVADRRVANV